MASPEQLAEFRKKALLSPRIGKRGKHKKTIAKEQARDFFIQQQLKKWELISDAQLEEALKDRQAREYTINQVIGKPTETYKHEVVKFDFDEDEVE